MAVPFTSDVYRALYARELLEIIQLDRNSRGLKLLTVTIHLLTAVVKSDPSALINNQMTGVKGEKTMPLYLTKFS